MAPTRAARGQKNIRGCGGQRSMRCAPIGLHGGVRAVQYSVHNSGALMSKMKPSRDIQPVTEFRANSAGSSGRSARPAPPCS